MPEGNVPGTTMQILYDAQGKPYVYDASGNKMYLSPWSMNQPGPGGATFFKSRPTWNPKTGKYETGPNWSNIASLATGAAIGAPFLSALAGGAGAAGAGSGAGAGAVGGGIAETAGLPLGLGAGAATLPAAGGALSATAGLPLGLGGAGASSASAAGIGGGIAETAGLPAALPGVTGPGALASAAAAQPGASWLERIRQGAGTLGTLAGNIATARQGARADENQSAYLNDRNAVDRYAAEQRAQLERDSNLVDRYRAEDLALQGRDRTALDRAALEQKNLLDVGKFNLDAPRQRIGNAVAGSLLQNLQPASISAPSTIPRFNVSGGLTPDALTTQARSLGPMVTQEALASQAAGPMQPVGLPTVSTAPGLPDLSAYTGAPPLTPMQRGSGLDTGLNTIGFLGALSALFGPSQAQQLANAPRRT